MLIRRRHFVQTFIYVELKYCTYDYKLFGKINEIIYDEKNQNRSNSLLVYFHPYQTELNKE